MLVWRTEEAYITSTSNCSHDAARVDARSRRIWPTIRHLARKITRYKHVMYIFRRRRRRRRVLALKTGPARHGPNNPFSLFAVNLLSLRSCKLAAGLSTDANDREGGTEAYTRLMVGIPSKVAVNEQIDILPIKLPDMAISYVHDIPLMYGIRPHMNSCTLALPGEYDWTIVARRRCVFTPVYFDHLLSFRMRCLELPVIVTMRCFVGSFRCLSQAFLVIASFA